MEKMMNESVTSLTQSNFYSPAFNAAIFDGPIRLYFAQYQEAVALKIYFRMQNELKEGYQRARELHRQVGKHLFVMLYPSSEAFDTSFPERGASTVCRSRLGDDDVVGIRGLIPDEEFEKIYDEISDIFDTWRIYAPVGPSLTV
jgi:hypothetical protein